jgi:hypothetical protein
MFSTHNCGLFLKTNEFRLVNLLPRTKLIFLPPLDGSLKVEFPICYSLASEAILFLSRHRGREVVLFIFCSSFFEEAQAHSDFINMFSFPWEFCSPSDFFFFSILFTSKSHPSKPLIPFFYNGLDMPVTV